MKKKLTIIDLISPSGHSNFVKNLISILNSDYEVLLIASSEFVKSTGYPHSIALENKYFHYRNRFEFVIKQIWIIKMVSKIIRARRVDGDILLTSFENISFAFSWRTIFANAIIHNNLEKKGLSKLFFNKISSKIAFFAFEEYIAEYVINTIKKPCAVLPHTMNFTPNDHLIGKSKTVFAPSGGNDFSEYLSTIKDFLSKEDLTLLAKSQNSTYNSDRIQCMQFFENYEELLSDTKYVLLSNEYSFRISGVFYDAMCFNKIIIVNDLNSLFLQSMKQKYPNSIFRIADFPIQLSSIDKFIDFNKFLNSNSNSNIIQSFNYGLHKKSN